jgi:bacterioferritin-associated ferredoxin
MYLCLCYGVTDGKIKALIAEGALSLQELQKICQAGTDCGSCVCEIKKLLRQKPKRPEPPSVKEESDV